MSRNCFCDDLKECQERYEKAKKLYKEDFEASGIKKRFTIALVEYSYKGQKTMGKLIHYNDYRYNLNYCPECGRPLKEEKK